MGEKIELKGYQGYAAGLDTKSKDFVILVYWTMKRSIHIYLI